jgi:hypothetical protein
MKTQSHHPVVTTTHVSPELENLLKSWVTAGRHVKPLCIGIGSKQSQNSSHIPFIHMQGQ